MTKKLAVLVIHGMGSQNLDFAEGMIEEINRRIDSLSLDSNSVAWKPIFWADILESKEVEYLRNAKKNHDLDFIGLRRFVVTALGDATAYQQVISKANTTYQKIHDRVKEKTTELYMDLDGAECPLVVIAHSLGGHIMSNYIWDMQKTGGGSLSSFEKMEYLAGFVTFGCNIPLFTFAYDNVVPIDFPGAQIKAMLRSDGKPKWSGDAKWLNYYDPDDVLGYPLKAINNAYDKVVAEDIAINVGGILTSWNPASHSEYWTDDDFTIPVAKFLGAFL